MDRFKIEQAFGLHKTETIILSLLSSRLPTRPSLDGKYTAFLSLQPLNKNFDGIIILFVFAELGFKLKT